MTTEERLEQLERECAREKRRFLCWRVTLLILIGAAAIGFALLPKLPIRVNEVRPWLCIARRKGENQWQPGGYDLRPFSHIARPQL